MKSRFALALCLGLLGGCVLYDFDAPSPEPEEPEEPIEPPIIHPEPPTLAQEIAARLKEWSGCMSLENFTSTNMAPAWSSITTTGGNCTSCHTAGTVEYPVSSDAAAFFQVLSERKLALLQFFTVDVSTRPGKVVITVPPPFEAIGSGAPPHTQHPRFTVGTAPKAALAAFYDATVARKAAGTCDPPRLLD